MSVSFFEPCGSLISPGDILDKLPPVKLPATIRIARKWSQNLPAKYRVRGELHEVMQLGNDLSMEDSLLDAAGEQVLVAAKMSRAVFLTWGSEVEDDERSGKVDKKDWLIAPILPIPPDAYKQKIPATGETMADAIKGNKSARCFYVPSLSSEEPGDYYVDFRRICPIAAGHVRKITRNWRFSPSALNDFYHQLIWFFTRKRVFFEPLECHSCGAKVDLNLIFEGQPLDPEPSA
jgi:hypothetical protein